MVMKQNRQRECATAVALALFDFIQLTGDEIVYDVNRAIDLIEAYGNRRVREALLRPRRGSVVPLRLVGRSG